MPRLPIRWKITLWSAGVTGGTLLVFTVGTLINLYIDQIQTADLAMRAEARHLLDASPAETRYGGWWQHIPANAAAPLLACSIDPADDRFINAPDSQLDAFARRAAGITIPRNLSRKGGHWRVCSYEIDGREILLAYDLFDVSDRITDLIAAFLLAFPIATIVAAIGAWIVAGRALAPVRAATETAAAIEAGALDLRLPHSAVNDEIGHLTTMLNRMLERLEKNFRQAVRFTADASHELRTPLTIMRGEIEILLSRDDLPAGAETRLVSLHEEVARLNRIIEHLLLLARFDAGKVDAVRERVQLDALVREACDDAELFASGQSVRLETAIAPGVVVDGDPGQLRRVLLNLLDNACKFNVPGGLVRCSLEMRAGEARLAVANTGPGIPAESRPRVFDRFFCVDNARHQPGHGLGLSLCREIVHAHGGKITLTDDASVGLTEFVVTLPARSS